MLIVPDYQAAAFPNNEQHAPLLNIPSVQKQQVGNKEVLLMPHKVTETIQANMLGYAVPSPIWYYYPWSGLFTPMDHQRYTAAFLSQNNRALVLNDIGTGKTLSALWAADYLNTQNMTHKWLIIAPLSTLQTVWANTLFTHFPHRTYTVIHGDKQRRLNKLRNSYEFYIINHDGLEVVYDELISRGDIHGIIFDEATVMRNRKRVFKLFTKWIDARLIQWIWLMTGTPTPNEPPDAWALGHIMKAPLLTGVSYTAFKKDTMYKDSDFRWSPKPDALDKCKKILVPSIRYKRKDCVDLPPLTYITHKAEMTATQKAAYKDMAKRLMVEYEKGEIVAANDAVKMMKLCQIAAGCLYDTERGDITEYPPTNKLKLLKQIIDEDGGKVIVFVNFKATIPIVQRFLEKHYSVSSVYSATSKGQRDAIFTNFQVQKDPRVLLAHPQTMAHGLTLTAANTVIWYTPTQSNEIYMQGNGRIERIGQTDKMTVVHLVSSEVEQRIFARLQGKQRLQGLLLEMLELKEVA